VLIGWDSIRRSWDQIFAGTGWIRVTATDVEVVSMGAHGLVVCAENISAQNHDQVGVAVAQATNVYKKTAEGWRMIHHHASPAPVEVTGSFSGGFS
jgi:ketosteroid isomerase-like protein